MTSILAAAIMTLVTCADPEPPSDAELAAITGRGRDLAGYDRAAWHASDALQAAKPKASNVTGYIARKTDKGWVVAFGRLDEEKDAYLIAYEASQAEKADEFTIKTFDPPKPDTGFLRSAAKSSDVALKDFTEHFRGERRPYNLAVLTDEMDQYWVYLTPAPTEPGVWPLGGDVRYRITDDGTKILDKRQLHKSVIELERPKADAQDQVAGLHTHVLAEIPEDTDVFHVLSRQPSVPELIRTEHFVFVIEPDGTAKFVGKADEVLKKE